MDFDSAVHIRPFQADDAEYEAVTAISARVPHDELCDFEQVAAGDLQQFDAGLVQAGHEVRRFVAEVPALGQTVGFAHVFPATWGSDPRRRFWMHVRVLPAWQRRGIGSALYVRAQEEAWRFSADVALSEVRETHAETAQWLSRAGFRELFRSWELRLDVRRANVAAIRRYLEKLNAAGIELTTLAAELRRDSSGTMERLFDLHCTLLRDVPLPEQVVLTREWFERYASILPEGYFIARQHGRYIGESFAHPQEGSLPTLAQRITGVLDAYRGQGVAMALKLKMIAFARQHGYAQIRTWVESTNEPMLAVSRKLGFVQYPGLVIFEKSY